MELIDHLKPPTDAPKEVLQFYFKILDDRADGSKVRDNKTSEKFSGPGAGFPYEKLAMRDFIHLHYARWLKWKIKPPEREKETPEQWEKFRDAVSEKLGAYQKENGLK